MSASINLKRSEAMRLSWAKRKAAALNGEMIEVGRVVTAVNLASRLVSELNGNRAAAHAIIDGISVTGGEEYA